MRGSASEGLRQTTNAAAYLLLCVVSLGIEGALTDALGLQNLGVQMQPAMLAMSDCDEEQVGELTTAKPVLEIVEQDPGGQRFGVRAMIAPLSLKLRAHHANQLVEKRARPGGAQHNVAGYVLGFVYQPLGHLYQKFRCSLAQHLRQARGQPPLD